MKRLAIMLFAVSLPVLAACNTVQGVGKDVEATGEVIQDAGTQ